MCARLDLPKKHENEEHFFKNILLNKPLHD